MSNRTTADRILKGLKRRVIVPSNQALYDDDDLLEICDDIVSLYLSPLMISLRQDYFVKILDTPLVQDVSVYDIPPRALGMALRDVKLRDSAGNVRDMDLITPEDEHLFRKGGTSRGFYFRNDQLVIVPPNENDDLTLEIWHEQRPSELVPLSKSARVSAIAGDVVTVESLPSELTVSTSMDFIYGETGLRLKGIDATPTDITGMDITFASGVVPSDLVVGDYLAEAGKSPFLMTPKETRVLLETRAGMRLLGGLGDFDGKTELSKDISAEEKYAKTLMEPRITGEETKIINRRGLLNGRRGRFGRRGYIY